MCFLEISRHNSGWVLQKKRVIKKALLEMFPLKSKSSTEHLRQNDWLSGTVFLAAFLRNDSTKKQTFPTTPQVLSSHSSRCRKCAAVCFLYCSSSGCWTHNPLFSLVIRPHYYWLNMFPPAFLGVVCSAENKYVCTVQNKKKHRHKKRCRHHLFLLLLPPISESNYCIRGM